MQQKGNKIFIRPRVYLNEEQADKLNIILKENDMTETDFFSKIIVDLLDVVEIYAVYSSNIKDIIELPKPDIEIKKKQ